MPDSPDSHLPATSALVHFETMAKIENERTKQLFTPTANTFQRRLFEAYETLLAVMQAVDFDFEIRILGLKIRQCGGTTASNHIIYHHSQRFATDSVIMTDVKPSSKEVLLRMKTLSKADLYPWRNPLDPLSDQLAWANGSRCQITSAETPNAGIGRTRQAALLSEVCKYPRGGVKDDKAIMAGILPSINQLVIAESTPDGASGWFFEQYHGTKDMPGALNLDDFIAELKKGNRKPGNGWVKVFAAWWEFPENWRPVSSGERATISDKLTPREANGIATYGWSIEQIAWRRDMLFSECGGDESLFDSYYPEDDVSCFLSSGRPRFNMGAIVNLERKLVNYTTEEGALTPQRDGVVFVPQYDNYSPIQIFERPRAGCKYLVWCDPATGEDQTEGKDPDRHSIGVLRAGYVEGDTWRNHKVVARVRPPCTSEGDVIIDHIANLSAFYGDCLVVLEINMGHYVLKGLKDRGVPLFKREVIDLHDRDGPPKLQYGYKLKDRDQRREIVVSLAAHLRDGAIDIPCPHILKEAKTFIIDKNGKETARAGCHDDDILGLGMGLVSIGGATLYRGAQRVRRKPIDHRQWKRHPGY